MKLKLILFIGIFTLLTSSIPIIVAPQGFTYRTIDVDGETGDWSGIMPIVQDPMDDNGVDYEFEDIKAVYAAWDDDNLYFLMELHLWDSIFPEQVHSREGEYKFYIDILPDQGDPGNCSADFYILYAFHEGSSNAELSPLTSGSEVEGDGGLIAFSSIQLYFWTGEGWQIYPCTDVMGWYEPGLSIYNIEVGVAWECIGGKDCFNCFFTAHYEQDFAVNKSDRAPDPNDEDIVVGCCPVKPIGGEIVPSNALFKLAPYAAILAIAILAGFSIIEKKRIK